MQVLFNLYATSVVTAVAYDAARRVAGADGGPGSMAQAEAEARQSLGRYADRVNFDWSATDGETVVLGSTPRTRTCSCRRWPARWRSTRSTAPCG